MVTILLLKCYFMPYSYINHKGKHGSGMMVILLNCLSVFGEIFCKRRKQSRFHINYCSGVKITFFFFSFSNRHYVKIESVPSLQFTSNPLQIKPESREAEKILHCKKVLNLSSKQGAQPRETTVLAFRTYRQQRGKG